MKIIEAPVLREGKTVCINDIIFVGTGEPDQTEVKPTIEGKPVIDLKVLSEKIINTLDIETVAEKLKEVKNQEQQSRLTVEITKLLEKRLEIGG